VIEVFGEVGKTDGSTPDSLNARMKTLEEAGLDPTGAIVETFNDFVGAGNGGEGWQWYRANQEGNGKVYLAPSLTASAPDGFALESSGVAILSGDAGEDDSGTVLFVRSAQGVNCDSNTFPVIEFKIRRPAKIDGDEVEPADDCLAYVGLGTEFGDDGPDKAVVLGFDFVGAAIVATTIDGGFDEATIDTCSGVPAGQVLRVRLTVGDESTVVEMSANDGKTWVTVCTTSVAAAPKTYLPFAGFQTKSDTGSGPRFFCIDWVKTRSVRGGDGASAFDGENALEFPNPLTEQDREKLDFNHQPLQRGDVTGTSDTIVADDVGGVVFYTNDCTVTLNDLSGARGSGRAMVLTLQQKNTAKTITVDPGSGVTIDGSASNYIAATGRARVVLVTQNGVDWYSGTP